MTLERSIIATLSYSDHFSFPLTLSELHTRLIQFQTDKKSLRLALTKMIDKGVISHTGNYYYLPNRKKTISARDSKSKSSEGELQKACELAHRIGEIKGVIAVYLTGSLAMKNSDSDADIDFMIITNRKRLWTTRMLLTFFLEYLGQRRRPLSKISPGKVCLNLYLTPDSFTIPSHKLSLYTAYELIQAIPLHDPFSIHTLLLSANHWVSDFLPNYPYPPKTKTRSKKKQINSSKILDLLERILYRLQLLYMRGKLTREYITPDSAFFHPNDPGTKVLKKLSI